AELEIPLGSGARELGLRPSIFVDAGAVWGVKRPTLDDTTVNGTFVPQKDPSGNPLFTQIDAAELQDGVCTPTQTSQVTNPLDPNPPTCQTANQNSALGQSFAFKEFFVGDTWKPRIAIGIGVNWNSPFGPFRIDFAKVLLKQEGDDTKAFTFN